MRWRRWVFVAVVVGGIGWWGVLHKLNASCAELSTADVKVPLYPGIQYRVSDHLLPGCRFHTDDSPQAIAKFYREHLGQEKSVNPMELVFIVAPQTVDEYMKKHRNTIIGCQSLPGTRITIMMKPDRKTGTNVEVRYFFSPTLMQFCVDPSG